MSTAREEPSDESGARRGRIRAERGALLKTVVAGGLVVGGLGATCFLAPDLAPIFGVIAALALVVAVRFARHAWRRVRVRTDESSPALRAALERRVAYYGGLNADDARRFREEVELFLLETRIVGVGVPVDDEIRALVAASAVIPVFRLPGWRWSNVHEVLLYASAFSPDFRSPMRGTRDAVGVVGDRELRGTMILTRPYLELAFARARDGRHTGIHEFAHLIDWADGSIDGTPAALLPRAEGLAWIELVRKEMLRIEAGRSILDRYALTNPAEFFAVASEEFFERPEALREKHRELYDLLTHVYRQRTHELTFAKLRDLVLPPPSARNAPCPCGSGKKLKRCCAAR